jgi:hypothetical protein
MIKLFTYVLISWAPNGVANAHPVQGHLTMAECAVLASNASTDESKPVPACVPDDVDF